MAEKELSYAVGCVINGLREMTYRELQSFAYKTVCAQVGDIPTDDEQVRVMAESLLTAADTTYEQAPERVKK